MNAHKQLLAFAEHMANHSSGNLQGFYRAEMIMARRAVKAAGGTLQDIGCFRADETEPMSHEAYDRRKDERKVERVLAALKRGPVRFISDDIYDIDTKRICTHGELVGWICKWLKRLGHKTVMTGKTPNATWSLKHPQPQQQE